MLSEYEEVHRQKFIDGNRDMMDWFIAHPDLRAPISSTYAVWDYIATDVQEFLELRRAAGATEKTDRDIWLAFSKRFDEDGNRVIHINIEKEKTCERVQVGEKVLPAEPAKDERVVPVYEWRCSDPLLAREHDNEP